MKPEEQLNTNKFDAHSPEHLPVVGRYSFTRDHQHVDIMYLKKKHKDEEQVKFQRYQIDIKAGSAREARMLKGQIDNEWRAVTRVRYVKRIDPHIQDLLTAKGTESELYGTLLDECEASDAVFLLQHSKIEFCASLGNLQVYCCNPDIFTVPADAILIAVGPELHMNDSTVGATLASIDPESSENLRKLYSPICSPEPGECIELPVCDENSLYRLYLVVVVTDQQSLGTGINKALDICLSKNYTSLVTNLIGSDMAKVLKPDDSARIIFSSVTKHTEKYGEKSIQSLYICEINRTRIESLKKEWVKHTKEIDHSREGKACGAISVTVCSSDRKTASSILSSARPLIENAADSDEKII